MSDPKTKLTDSVKRMKAVQDAVKEAAEKIRKEKEVQKPEQTPKP